MILRESQSPIIMLTGKGDVIDRVGGLELGADDYVTKPFSMRELIARVRALLRRSNLTRGPTAQSMPPETVKSGDLELDLAAHTVYLRNQPLDLKPREFDLLSLLMTNRGRAFTRDQILERLWGYDFIGDNRTVDVHIRWLREKIEVESGSPKRIITIRGVGYRFQE